MVNEWVSWTVSEYLSELQWVSECAVCEWVGQLVSEWVKDAGLYIAAKIKSLNLIFGNKFFTLERSH